MKLESLKIDKFAPFKANEIQNAMKIVGGVPQDTTYRNIRYTGTDTLDFGTSDRNAQGLLTTVEGHTGAVDYAHLTREAVKTVSAGS